MKRGTQYGEPMQYVLAHLTAMSDDCTTWPYAHSLGYARLTMDGKKVYAHIMVCEWYHGPRPPGLQVRHLCRNGQRGCFNPRHMRWGTAKENAADRRRAARPTEGSDRRT